MEYITTTQKHLKCNNNCGGCLDIPIETTSDKPNIIILRFSPDKEDREFNRGYLGRAGATVRSLLRYLQNKHEFSYALAYLSQSDNPLESRNCINAVLNYIKQVQPKHVILMGGKVISMFLKNTSIEKSHGKPISINVDDLTFSAITTYDINFGILNIDALGIIYEDIENAIAGKITFGEVVSDYEILTNEKQVKHLTERLIESKKPIVFDIETRNLTKFHNKVLTLQFSIYGEKVGYCVPWKHPGSPFAKTTNKIRKYIKQFANATTIPGLIGHNLQFDYTMMLCSEGIVLSQILFDTMYGAYLLDETHASEADGAYEGTTRLGSYSLDAQIKKYGNVPDSYFAAKSNRANLEFEPLSYVASYGVGDVVYNGFVLQCQLQEAERQDFYDDFITLLKYLYSPFIHLFSEIEINGCPIDKQYLECLINKNNSPLLKIKRDIIEELNKCKNVVKLSNKLSAHNPSVFGSVNVFDVTKVDHKLALFFDQMQLEPLSFGKPTKQYPDGQPAIDKEFKEHYRDQYEEVDLFAKITRIDQLWGLYCKSFIKFLDHQDNADGNLRPQIKGNGTRSGRISVVRPNLQQTVRQDGSEITTIVRGLFYAPKGHVIIKLDLKTNEVRWWGDLSRDPSLISLFKGICKLGWKYFFKGPSKKLKEKLKYEGDPHTMNAAFFYSKNVKEVTKEDRNSSKSMTFGVIYGLTMASLSKVMNKSEEETKDLVDNVFFGRFKKGRRYLENAKKFARRKLFVRVPLGNRRRLWHFILSPAIERKASKWKTKWDKRIKSIWASGERRAMNSPIQGIGSHANSLGAYLTYLYIKRKVKNWKMFNLVHDSLEAIVPVNEIVDYCLAVKLIYEKFVERYIRKYFKYDMKIPIEIEFEIGTKGNNMVKWDGAHASLLKLQKQFQKESK